MMECISLVKLDLLLTCKLERNTHATIEPKHIHFLNKGYEQIHLLLINEASLIGSQMLYNIDKRPREIMHTPTKPFGGIDVIFCGIYARHSLFTILVFLNNQNSKNKNFHIDFGMTMSNCMSSKQ